MIEAVGVAGGGGRAARAAGRIIVAPDRELEGSVVNLAPGAKANRLVLGLTHAFFLTSVRPPFDEYA